MEYQLQRTIVKKMQQKLTSEQTDTVTAEVGWLEFNVPFQHKYGYIRDERSGWRAILLPSEESLVTN